MQHKRHAQGIQNKSTANRVDDLADSVVTIGADNRDRD